MASSSSFFGEVVLNRIFEAFRSGPSALNEMWPTLEFKWDEEYEGLIEDFSGAFIYCSIFSDSITSRSVLDHLFRVSRDRLADVHRLNSELVRRISFGDGSMMDAATASLFLSESPLGEKE